MSIEPQRTTGGGAWPIWRAAGVLALLVETLTGCAPHVREPLPQPGFAGVDRARHEAVDSRFMVVSQGDATSLAAREMLLNGGNIFDAAAAASFVVAVERPQSTGIGGGGFMLIHHAATGKVQAVDFREQAPLAATETLFQDATGQVIPKRSTEGILASGVPGMVAGVLAVHRQYGRLPRRTVMAPAIRLAREGIKVYPHLAEAMQAQAAVLSRFPASRSQFLHSDGTPYRVGESLHQPDLAKTLEAIAEHGAEGFYRGWVADALLAQHRRLGGLLTRNDLEGYAVKWREPVVGQYADFEVFSMPPPSSGGIHVIEILNLLESRKLGQFGPQSVESIHATALAMQQAFADRAAYLGDSDFTPVPTATLTSKAYAKRLIPSLAGPSARPSSQVKAGPVAAPEHTETTHFTIADRDGNVVASTQTINGWFGSGVVVEGAGFLLNNEMDDFSAKPGVPNAFGVIGGKANAIAPGKRPLSSMSPTLVRERGKPRLALGSPSGSRIITCVALTTLNYLEYGLPLYDSVAALRYHHQWLPDEIEVEPPGFAAATAAALRQRGHHLAERGIGCKVQALAFENGRLHGVSDPRGDGLAVGSASPVRPASPATNVPLHRD